MECLVGDSTCLQFIEGVRGHVLVGIEELAFSQLPVQKDVRVIVAIPACFLARDYNDWTEIQEDQDGQQD
jgi:hypothetical protein